MPSPCLPPLASWANVVITYLPSDFLGLWQAMQFRTRMGATSRMKLRGFTPAFFVSPAFGVSEGLASWARETGANDRERERTKASMTDPRTGCIGYIRSLPSMSTSMTLVGSAVRTGFTIKNASAQRTLPKKADE